MPNPNEQHLTSNSSDHAAENSEENHRQRAEVDPNSANHTTNDDQVRKVRIASYDSFELFYLFA